MGEEELKRLLNGRSKNYNVYYKHGKKASDLATLQVAYGVSYNCPVCGRKLVVSDWLGKDFICLPCEKYYMKDTVVEAEKNRIENYLHDFERDEEFEDMVSHLLKEWGTY